MQQHRSVQGQAAVKIWFRQLKVRRTKQDFNSRRLNHIFHNSRRKGACRLPLPLRHRSEMGLCRAQPLLSYCFCTVKTSTLPREALCRGFICYRHPITFYGQSSCRKTETSNNANEEYVLCCKQKQYKKMKGECQ